MHDALISFREELLARYSFPGASIPAPLVADSWIVSSLLQKAIRRGESSAAQQAAHTLLMQRGTGVWRRLMVIAFEDVGAAASDIVAAIVAVSTDPDWRRANGGNERVVMAAVGALADAVKDRSTDYLTGCAKDDPALEQVRSECRDASREQRREAIADLTRPLEHRAVFAWSAFGPESGGEQRFGRSDLPALLDIFRGLGTPEALVVATGVAARRTREPLIIMAPLVWLAAHRGAQRPSIRDCLVPPTPSVNDISLYALDMHTRTGREAIGQFAKDNADVRTCLERYVPERRRHEATLLAAFYADAAPISRRLVWEQSERLEQFGTECDLTLAGVPIIAQAPLLNAVRSNLEHLNELRARALLSRTQKLALRKDDLASKFVWTEGDVTYTNDGGSNDTSSGE